MVYHIGAAPDKASVGFYAGIIESLFAVSQTLTILFWGSLSDRIGRKPVLLTGLTGVACSAILFGLSRSFVWAVLARSMAGATNGNVAIVKSVMGELTDRSNQAKAFSLLPLTWTVGCLIGPLLGGIVLGVFFLEETLPEIVQRKKLQKLQQQGNGNNGGGREQGVIFVHPRP
ncbi:hypothetical protein [Sporisorium scitamineum]|uniref:Major facilitator superfamily (MFS) profile domain-containing protein n=1 Tax=Sporisorium scitamineum TaxID=49012 RepID=A0A0F7SC04_9BASI|nr:hypothetical protein [Sporisorium scitamineum]